MKHPMPRGSTKGLLEAVSVYSVQDVIGKGFSYYPPFWTDEKILGGRFAPSGSLPDDLSFPENDVNVLVSVELHKMEDLKKLIPLDNEYSGLSRDELFYKYFQGQPIIGVHVRATDKVTEQPVPSLRQIVRKTN